MNKENYVRGMLMIILSAFCFACMNVCVRLSGDLLGSAPIIIVGPKGAVSLKEGCIIAKRHIHMSPEDAAAFGVHDKQVVTVQAPGARGGMLEEVPVRVDKSFTTEMHIDTDEANGLGIANGAKLPVIV